MFCAGQALEIKYREDRCLFFMLFKNEFLPGPRACFKIGIFPAVLLLTFATFGQSPPSLTVLGCTDNLKLGVQGDATTSYCIQTSTDLRNWESMAVIYPATGIYPPSTQFEVVDREFLFEGQRFYRAAISDVCLPPGTNSAQMLLLSDEVLTFYEGSNATLSVQLASLPSGAVTVTAARTSGSTNIAIINGTNLVFTPTNWSTPQIVTVAAGRDADMQDSKATLTISMGSSASEKVQVLAVDSGTDDEFVGPFASWMNVKADFGAKGDGINDDTAALQSALDSLRPNTNKAVLYFPAGTYRITQTLNVIRTAHSESKDIMIVGQDPATTTLRWDGATSGVMMAYGAWYAKLSRLTFDGRSKARTAVAHGSMFSTYNEFSDSVFKDLSFGIEAGTPSGQGNAETAVERCQFLRCAQAGISVQNPNSLDWFVWNSEFDDCGLGVSNIYGAGNYHVYECLFRNSTQADMSIGNTGYFSVRNNTSIGSLAFFTATAIPSCGLVTLQGNTVLSPLGVPIQIGNYGPVLLLDNCIQDYGGVAANIEPSAAFFSVGNTFTVSNAIPKGFFGPAGIRLDDVVSCPKIPLVLPRLPGALPNLNRPVIDLPGPTNAAGIQAAINLAATLSGQRPVVHLPFGIYSIEQTITIPAGCDLQLAGDGARSALRWSGSNAGPVLRLAGPSRATLRDFIVFGTFNTNQADDIVIENCDQPGGRVYLDQAYVDSAQQIGLFAEGLVKTSVVLDDFYHGQNAVSVRVQGGGGPPPYEGSAGQVAIFGGASSLNGLTYDVNSGGKLLARDIWYEANGTNASGRFMSCTDSGSFTLHGANIAPSMATLSTPVILASNFVGRLTFLTTQFSFSNNSLTVTGNGTNTSVLLLGTVDSNQPNFSAPQSQASLLQSFQSPDNLNFDPMLDQGPQSADFLRTMLAQTRNGRPPALTPLPPAVTDVRFHRVEVEGGRIGIHLKK
jgi:hypothetical protein